MPKQALEEVLEMIMQTEDGAPAVQADLTNAYELDRAVLEGLTNIAQHLFRDTETKSVTLPNALSALESLAVQAGKSSIQEKLKKLERKGNISRTDLNDLIENLEEVEFNDR